MPRLLGESSPWSPLSRVRRGAHLRTVNPPGRLSTNLTLTVRSRDARVVSPEDGWTVNRLTEPSGRPRVRSRESWSINSPGDFQHSRVDQRLPLRHHLTGLALGSGGAEPDGLIGAEAAGERRALAAAVARDLDDPARGEPEGLGAVEVDRLVGEVHQHCPALGAGGADPAEHAAGAFDEVLVTGVRAWIEDVVVDADARGRGVGEALNLHAIERARALDAKTVDLTSRPSREAANRLYQRIGFQPRETNVYRFDIT